MVGGQRITVQVVADLDDWGNYDHDEKKIHLARRACRKQELMLEILRHEMVHAALHIGGVAYSENFEEEAIVRCMDDIFFPAWTKIQKRYEQ